MTGPKIQQEHVRTGLDEQRPLLVEIVDREEVCRGALSAGRLVWEVCALFPKSLVSFTRRKDLVPISSAQLHKGNPI
jgi:hypothetical protein